MSYAGEIFDRLGLSQYRDLLLYEDSPLYDVRDRRSYDAILKDDCEPIYNRLKNIYRDDKKEIDNANTDLIQALTAYENVYMEIGMKAGARIIFDLIVCAEQKNG